MSEEWGKYESVVRNMPCCLVKVVKDPAEFHRSVLKELTNIFPEGIIDRHVVVRSKVLLPTTLARVLDLTKTAGNLEIMT